MNNTEANVYPVVLVVDDEPELLSLLFDYLGRYGLTIRTAENALAARAAVAAEVPALVILDLNMPGENGLSLARWLRDSHPQIGLLMLTTASESIDRIVGLELGADDYMPKPFEMRELLARVRAIIRRATVSASSAAQTVGTPAQPAKTVDSANRVRVGACWLDLVERRLLDADGVDIQITAGEFDLLALFVRQPNRPLSRDQIMEQAHNKGWDVFDRSIDLRVMRLRRKIEQNPDKPEVLKTVRGAGYMFVQK